MGFNMDQLLEQYGSFFQAFGISRQDLTSHYDEWQKQRQNTAVTDYLWYLFQVLLGETKKQVANASDYHRNLHEIYLKMLEFRVTVDGKRDNNLVQLIIRNRIQQWQHELPFPFRLQAVSFDCCEHCGRIHGHEFEAVQVLQDPYFASPECTNENGCSCGYIPVAVKES